MKKLFGFVNPKDAAQEEVKEKRWKNASNTETINNKNRNTQPRKREETPRFGNVPQQTQGEQVAAGWPSWLTAVAGEALRGWIPRRADSFEKIDKIGQGTYSNVYKVRDLETGKVVALKKVRFDNLEPESVHFMAREIKILRRLDHPNVVKLEGLVTSRMSCSLYLVFEYLDHDLAEITASTTVTFTESQVKCYILQILRGLEHCHSRRVLHRDIKGSNLLLDKDGNLKIADFGLATFFNPDKQQQLTTRVVTLWYRPPELLLGATEYGVAIDLWSVGCILGELFVRKPILPGKTEVEQLHRIFKLCGSPSDEYWRKYKRLSHASIFRPQQPYKRSLAETHKNLPQTALDLMDVLLAIEPDARGSASTALKSEFFTIEPLACEPSDLPKYVPRKEGGKDPKAQRQKVSSKSSKKDGAQEISSQGHSIQQENSEMTNKDDNVDGQGSSMTRIERLKASKETTSKLHADAPADDAEFIDYGDALSPMPRHSEKQANFSSGLPLARNPKEEDTSVMKMRTRSVRYSTISDLQTQTGNGNRAAGTGNLSMLSKLVAQKDKAHGANVNRLNVQDTLYPGRSKNKMPNRAPPKIHLSGPLLQPTTDLDRLLDERERQIQEALRIARRERARGPTQVDAYGANPWERRDGVGKARGEEVHKAVDDMF